MAMDYSAKYNHNQIVAIRANCAVLIEIGATEIIMWTCPQCETPVFGETEYESLLCGYCGYGPFGPYWDRQAQKAEE